MFEIVLRGLKNAIIDDVNILKVELYMVIIEYVHLLRLINVSDEGRSK